MGLTRGTLAGVVFDRVFRIDVAWRTFFFMQPKIEIFHEISKFFTKVYDALGKLIEAF